jgi:hypothetical protein
MQGSSDGVFNEFHNNCSCKAEVSPGVFEGGISSLKPLNLPRTASLSLEDSLQVADRTWWSEDLRIAWLRKTSSRFALLGDGVTIVVELLPL